MAPLSLLADSLGKISPDFNRRNFWVQPDATVMWAGFNPAQPDLLNGYSDLLVKS